MNNDFDALLDRINTTQNDTEEIPEPGTPENPWIGVERVVNGQKQFYALSGAERRRSIRAAKRADVAEQQKGQRRYNRQQRKQAFDAETARQQLRILKGELQVSFDMQNNLTRHILRQTKLNERAQTEPERKATAAARREGRLYARTLQRYHTGRATHADLVRLEYRDVEHV